MSEMTFRIIEILLPAVLALAGAAIYLGAAYLRKRTEAIESEHVRAIVWDALDRARIAARNAVQATAQTYVDDLKAAREDGKITNEEAAEARRRALQQFKTQMGDIGLSELEAVVGDVTEWFESYLEAVVNDLKGA